MMPSPTATAQGPPVATLAAGQVILLPPPPTTDEAREEVAAEEEEELPLPATDAGGEDVMVVDKDLAALSPTTIAAVPAKGSREMLSISSHEEPMDQTLPVVTEDAGDQVGGRQEAAEVVLADPAGDLQMPASEAAEGPRTDPVRHNRGRGEGPGGGRKRDGGGARGAATRWVGV